MASMDETFGGTLDELALDFDITAADLGDGSASSPSLAFLNDDDLGLYRIGSDDLGFAANGSKQASLDTNGLTLEDDNWLALGTDDDWRWQYDSANTRLELTDGSSDVLRVDDGTQVVDFQGAVNLATSGNIQDAGTDAIQFDGSANVTVPNGSLTLQSAGSLVLPQSTADYTVSWDDPSAARALTVPDPGSDDSFTFNDATQTLTSKTLSGPTLSGTTTYTNAGAGSDPTLASNDASQVLTLTGDFHADNLSLDGGTTTIDSSELNLLDGMTSVTGSDTNFVSGTAGSDNELVTWNADGDLIGETNLTFDGSALSVSGDVLQTSQAITASQRVTSNTTVANTDHLVVADASGGNVTITLPSSPDDGRTVVVKAIDPGSNSVTVARNGNNIDEDASNISLDNDNEAVILKFFSGQGWYVMARLAGGGIL